MQNTNANGTRIIQRFLNKRLIYHKISGDVKRFFALSFCNYDTCLLRHKVLRVQPQNEDQVRSMREILQSRKDVSTKCRAFFCVWAQTVQMYGKLIAHSVRRGQSALLEEDR